MSTPTDVVSLFPHSTILATHALGQAPTYKTPYPAITQLNANAASIPSNGGNGMLGHLLVLTLAWPDYLPSHQPRQRCVSASRCSGTIGYTPRYHRSHDC